METSRATTTLPQSDQHGNVSHGSEQVYDVASMPGFRFQPTEEELVGFYLRSMVIGNPRLEMELINVLDLYRYDPWELPAMAFMQGEREWLFFCPRDKKYPNGARPNRVTASGYWKATGTDRQVRRAHDARCIGLKKTLVFYTGKAPKGRKTEWIMNEYRLPLHEQHLRKSSHLKDSREVALCRIYKKPAPNPSTATLLCADSVMEEGLGAESSITYTPESGGLERDSVLANISSEQPCASTCRSERQSSPEFVNFDGPGKRPILDERDTIGATEHGTTASSHRATNANQHDDGSRIPQSSVKMETGTLSSVLYPCPAPENVDSIDALLAQLMDAEARRERSAAQIRAATPHIDVSVSTPGSHHELVERFTWPGDVTNGMSDPTGCSRCSSSNNNSNSNLILTPSMSTLDRLLKASLCSSSPLATHDDLLPVSSSSSSSFFSMNQFGWNYSLATHEPPWLHSSPLPARQSLLQDHFP